MLFIFWNIVNFDESAPATNLSEELTDIAQKLDKFKNSVLDKYLLQMFDELIEDTVGDDSPHELWDDQVVDKSKKLPKSKSCKKCPTCCATFLYYINTVSMGKHTSIYLVHINSY